MLPAASQRLLVVQSRVHQPLIAGAHRRERGDEISIIQAVIGARRFRQSIGETHQQMLALIGKLLGNFNLQKQRCGVKFIRGARLLMFARLLQIRTVARTIERHLALLATALRTNAPVYCGAEAFFLASLADRATQIVSSPVRIGTSIIAPEADNAPPMDARNAAP